ncbi:putative exodeoxyribonuclease 8 [Vibrio phage 1.105.O._10N.286.49.B4]|nr:putative exodeoxyribonuclease 8 [Vibrio phage 1.105.O._10N.286.49.B4]
MKLQQLTATELPEEQYHGEGFKDFLSGSELWAYIDTCPAEYVFGEKKETASLITGSAVHSEVLEMHTFDDLYYRGFEPTEDALTSDAAVKAKLKSLGITGYSTKSGQDLYDMLLKAEPDSIIKNIEEAKLEQENEGKTMLKFAQYDMAKAMRKQLMQYPTYAEYVLQGECEASIVGECELFGRKVKVKTRPDIIHEHSITNYKTTTSAKPSSLVTDSFNKGYFMKEVLNAIVYQEMHGYFPKINIMAQSKKAPYVVTMFEMTQDMIDIGMAQLEQAFNLWIACKDSGQVIDYAQGEILTDLEVPNWMITKTVS